LNELAEEKSNLIRCIFAKASEANSEQKNG